MFQFVLYFTATRLFSGFMPPPFFPPGFPIPGGRQPMVPTNPDEAWNEYTAPDGRKYYYNSITQENTWDKPQVLIDKECELDVNVMISESLWRIVFAMKNAQFKLENLLWIRRHLLLKRLLWCLLQQEMQRECSRMLSLRHRRRPRLLWQSTSLRCVGDLQFCSFFFRRILNLWRIVALNSL